MQMRRWWVGLFGVVGVSVGAACKGETVPPEPEDGGGKVTTAEESAFREDTVQALNALPCPTITAAQARAERIRIPRDSSRVIWLEGSGRNHYLQVWAIHSADRIVTLTEMQGDTNGVNLEISPAPESATVPWGLVNLDARGCSGDGSPIIVKRHADGVLTVVDGSYDSRTREAFGVLRGNSGYMLATPTAKPDPDP
jgi:hypothetical protein